MAWEDLPRFEPSRESLLKLRDKWKYGPCMSFRDDGLGYCMTCNWDHGADFRTITFKRIMVCVAIERMKAGELIDLFAETVDVPAAVEWFSRWMEFKAGRKTADTIPYSP